MTKYKNFFSLQRSLSRALDARVDKRVFREIGERGFFRLLPSTSYTCQTIYHQSFGLGPAFETPRDTPCFCLFSEGGDSDAERRVRIIH